MSYAPHMSLMRLFLQTSYELAKAGQFTLLAQYFALIAQIIATKEAVIFPGTPTDKPV